MERATRAVVEELAGADGDDLAAVGLFLGRVGQKDAAGGLVGRFDALDDDLGRKLTDEFARRTTKIIPTLVLCAAMITRRKGGALTTLRPKKDEADIGFSDLDEIAS